MIFLGSDLREQQSWSELLPTPLTLPAVRARLRAEQSRPWCFTLPPALADQPTQSTRLCTKPLLINIRNTSLCSHSHRACESNLCSHTHNWFCFIILAPWYPARILLGVPTCAFLFHPDQESPSTATYHCLWCPAGTCPEASR